MTNGARQQLLAQLARLIQQHKPDSRPLVVGITGMDTSGKSEMTRALSKELDSASQHIQLIHIDDFHRPRAQRYRTQLPEPVQYYDHSIDFERAAADVLRPIRANGELKTTLTLLDLPSDTWTLERSYSVTEQTIVLLEGVFLFRPEVRDLVDLFIYLHVEERVVLERGRLRDVPSQGEEVMRKYHTKYLPAQRSYLAAHTPESNAHVIIDNSIWEHPTITKWPAGTSRGADYIAN